MGHIVNRVLIMLVICLLAVMFLSGLGIPEARQFGVTSGVLIAFLFVVMSYATFEPGKLMRKFAGFHYSSQPDSTRFFEFERSLVKYRKHPLIRRTIWRIMKSYPDIELLKDLSYGVMRKMRKHPVVFSDEINDLRSMMREPHIAEVRVALSGAKNSLDFKHAIGNNITSTGERSENCLIAGMWFHGAEFASILMKDVIIAIRGLDATSREEVLGWLGQNNSGRIYDDARGDYQIFVTSLKQAWQAVS